MKGYAIATRLFHDLQNYRYDKIKKNAERSRLEVATWFFERKTFTNDWFYMYELWMNKWDQYILVLIWHKGFLLNI